MTGTGTILLLTRPRADCEVLTRALRDCTPADILIAPLVEIVAVGAPVDTSGYGGVVLTSANAVRHTLPSPGKPALCVGDRTAAAARAAGFDAVSAAGDANDLFALILSRRPDGPLLHVRGAQGGGDLARRLREAGIPTEDQVAYRQRELRFTDEISARLSKASRVVTPVYSPLGARRLSVRMPAVGNLAVVAISPTAAAAWTGPPAQVFVAPEPSGPAMESAIIAALDRDSPC